MWKIIIFINKAKNLALNGSSLEHLMQNKKFQGKQTIAPRT